ncbi:MAG: MBL fold metallo-hydrolase [Methanosarcinales archaeon]
MAILVDDEILLDYGIKPSDPPQYPIGGLRPGSVVISHGHLDHCGIAANLMDIKPDMFMTPVTRDMAVLLARDTMKIAESKGYVLPFIYEDIRDFELLSNTVNYGTDFELSGYNGRLYDAGHIPGSASVFLENENNSLIFTGDINDQDTHLIKSMQTLPTADITIIESTYFGSDHNPRDKLEDGLIASIEETVDSGGWAVIPAFAIGRTQEVLMILEKHGIQAWVDGMGVDVGNILRSNPAYLKDPGLFNKAFRYANVVNSRERHKVMDEPCAIVTTAGMLNGGPVLYYLSKMYNNPLSRILLTGYQVEGTNGRKIIEKGYYEDRGRVMHLKAKSELYDLSAHCGDKGLKKIVQQQVDGGCENVICVHGDNTDGFASWINENLEVNAISPVNTDHIHI